jgi:putative oxidoreductase
VPGMKQVIRWIPAIKGPLQVLLGMGLGIAFSYAGWQKLMAPYEFAEAIMAYQLLPLEFVGLTAAILPWLEVMVGVILSLGCLLKATENLAVTRAGLKQWRNLFCRSSLLLILIQVILFLAVLVITMAWGLKIDCGCGLFTDREVGLAAIGEDLFLLGVTAWLYNSEGKAKQEPGF